MTITNVKRVENSHIWQREDGEHYVEPRWTSRRLFDVEKFHFKDGRTGTVWDPFCGFGNIPEQAHLAGYGVTASDIVDRGCGIHRTQDFLTATSLNCNIVGNPPFNIFKECALRAIDLAAEKVALIWLTRTLPAARWLQDTPLARVWLLTPRPSMPPGASIARGEKPGGGKQDFCWLVWEKGFTGAPTINWLHRDGPALVKTGGVG